MPDNNNIMSMEGQLVGMPLAGPESFSQQQLDYLKRALGVDETVLWEDANGTQLQTGLTLSESRLNFERIKIVYAITSDGCPSFIEIPMLGANRGASFIQMLCASFDNHAITTAGYCLIWQLFFSECTDTYLKSSGCQFIGKQQFINGATTGTWTQGNNNACPIVFKIIGIHRIAGGN